MDLEPEDSRRSKLEQSLRTGGRDNTDKHEGGQAAAKVKGHGFQNESPVPRQHQRNGTENLI